MSNTKTAKTTPQNHLTHLDKTGAAQMVDIGEKKITQRVAIAESKISMNELSFSLITEEKHKKGDVLAVARIAGIQAAKKCSDLIPLCHPLMLTKISIELTADSHKNAFIIHARCEVDGKTGVEMEALTAASVAALTIYDMCKAVDKDMIIQSTKLLRKTGGKSGDYQRSSD